MSATCRSGILRGQSDISSNFCYRILLLHIFIRVIIPILHLSMCDGLVLFCCVPSLPEVWCQTVMCSIIDILTKSISLWLTVWLQGVNSSVLSHNYPNPDINLLAPELFFFNFNTSCIQNVNNTEIEYVRIMKQTAFWRGKNGEYIPCLKYSVPIFVE